MFNCLHKMIHDYEMLSSKPFNNATRTNQNYIGFTLSNSLWLTTNIKFMRSILPQDITNISMKWYSSFKVS